MIRVFGDFNCPYSALASVRADALIEAGVNLEWCAVERDALIPAGGQAVGPELRAALTEEVRHVRSLLLPAECLTLRVPAVLPQTASWAVAFASMPAGAARAFRRHAFAAVWAGECLDGQTHWRADDAGRELARRWQREWLGLERPIVPSLVLPDGYVSRGLGALSRLAALAQSMVAVRL